ncbi:MAG: DinB family protein [Gemmatimonadota bacterium]|nr:DinB family protein [Gemmatimonadota bacterium]
MPGYVAELRRAIEKSTPMLEKMSEDATSRRPAPGKWSPREIIGHLIDSASNNHQRFVRARFQEDLVFPGYDQDAWVAAQQYQETPWDELLALWRAFNLHIARVMEATPADQRVRQRERHNLDELAWKTVPRDKPATLDYFMADYVAHLQHHLRQIIDSE